jgi:hypothetical protein
MILNYPIENDEKLSLGLSVIAKDFIGAMHQANNLKRIAHQSMLGHLQPLIRQKMDL